MSSFALPHYHSYKLQTSVYVAMFGIFAVFGCYFLANNHRSANAGTPTTLNNYPLCKTLILATEQTVFTNGNTITTSTLNTAKANISNSRLSIIVPSAKSISPQTSNKLGTIDRETNEAWAIYEQLSASDKIIADHILGANQ